MVEAQTSEHSLGLAKQAVGGDDLATGQTPQGGLDLGGRHQRAHVDVVHVRAVGLRRRRGSSLSLIARSHDGDAASPEDPTPQGHDVGRLDEDALVQALGHAEVVRALVREALVLRSGIDQTTVDRILAAGSAKGITALAWKADPGMRVAAQLQLRLGGIAPGAVLRSRDGIDYPLTPEEMDWQLDFFQTLSS
jgi:hypothetical protein